MNKYQAMNILKSCEKNISPLRMQKLLYFSYCLWVTYQKERGMPMKMISPLFDAKFQAWQYGPVEVDVYTIMKNYKTINVSMESVNVGEQNFIVNVYNRFLNYNDFQLVNISHLDYSWQKNFNSKSIFHNEEIKASDIVAEYYNKEWTDA